VSKDSDQTETAPRKFKLGPLGNLNQVTKGLAKTIRAMADGTVDSQVGARICNGLGIMRACLETQKLEQLEARMDEIAHRVARDRTNAARERTSTVEAQRLTNCGSRGRTVAPAGGTTCAPCWNQIWAAECPHSPPATGSDSAAF
jgi:hypothetical protein